MTHQFSRVPHAQIQRSSFDRSHGYKTTFDAGYLVPIFLDEALPGDTFNLRMNVFARLATPLKPIMDNMYMDTFFFAVPFRLVWSNWEKFNGAQDNPDDTTDFVTPTVTPVAPVVGELWDYFGLPINEASEVSAFYSRAYNLIWNEWFRDQNLQDSVVVDLDDGPDDPDDYVLLRRGKRHDYFTSALPWPQKGDAVSIPLLGMAPVTGIGKGDQVYTALNQTVYETGGTGSVTYNPRQLISDATAQVQFFVEEDPNNAGCPGIYADLSAGTAVTINALRESFAMQRMLERDARGGTRYIEIIKAHFGVTSPDARLQRPEYLGGGSSPINVTPVAQTSVAAATPQGNLAAIGVTSFQGHGFTKSFTDHCVIIGLVIVPPDLPYQQRVDRMFLRSSRYDYFWPALANIGEQNIISKEIYVDGSADDNDVFGYQERYA